MFLNKKQAKSYVFRLKKLCYTNNQGNQNIKIDQFSTKNANNQQNQPNSLPKNPLNVPPAVRLDAAFLPAVRTNFYHYVIPCLRDCSMLMLASGRIAI